MKNFDLTRYTPPGRSTGMFEAVFIWLLLLQVIWGLTFLGELAENVVLLNGERYQQLSAITDFQELMSGRMTALPICMLGMAAVAGINYSAFYQNSKSLYLMRRLPDRWELPRRYLAMPLAACGIYLVTAVLLFAVSVLAYRLMMPPAHLPADWLQSVKESVTTLSMFGV